MKIAQEKIFGPVLSVLSVSDFEEAVQVANDVQYGLSAAICTDRLHHARSFIDGTETGVVKSIRTPAEANIRCRSGGGNVRARRRSKNRDRKP